MASLSDASGWSGLIAAVHTPFGEDGRLNLPVVERQAEHLARQGLAGVFVCGTTGECHSLTLEERRQMTLEWSKAAPKAGLKWVVHVGGNALGDCQSLAEQAQHLGANAISLVAPSYFKPPGTRELVDFCGAVAARAPELPFFYYHIPGMTGVRLSAAEFLQAGRDNIPTLAGLKFSHNDLVELQECLVQPGFSVLFGIDEMLLAALAYGVSGAVGSTYNYAAPIYHRILTAFGKGDLNSARAFQAHAVRMVRIQSKYDVMVSGKALMREFGVDCGPVRLPLRRLNAEQCGQLRKELEAVPELVF